MTNIHFLRVSDVALKLGLTVAQVYRHIHAGRLEAALGSSNGKSCYLLSPEAVDRFIAAGPALAEGTESVFVRPAEAGRMLGLSSEQIRRMVHDGKLSAQRNGPRGVMRIRRAEVENMAAGRTDTAV